MAVTGNTGLEARDVHLWRGDRHVLRGVSLQARAGDILHVRGPNGSGKTSLLRTLAGFLWPEQGDVLWNGRSTDRQRDEFSSQLAYLGHENALKADLSPLENLLYEVGLRHPATTAAVRETLLRLGIDDAAERPARSLSAGQRRRSAMARIVLSQADLWVLDEPFTNIDVDGTAHITRVIEEHAARGGIVVLAAHQELQVAGATVRRLDLQ